MAAARGRSWTSARLCPETDKGDALTETRTAPRPDRRVERSRTALRNAFHQLVLERGYDAIAVADVTELANVGRSTFYQHYAGLDDLLTQSLAEIFAALS